MINFCFIWNDTDTKFVFSLIFFFGFIVFIYRSLCRSLFLFDINYCGFEKKKIILKRFSKKIFQNQKISFPIRNYLTFFSDAEIMRQKQQVS
jgi:hypothetical protein